MTNGGFTLNVLVVILAAVLMVACAPHSDEIRAQEVSVEPYQDLSCTELQARLNSNIIKLKALAITVDKAAETDEGQTAAGLILFWPILFALEGSETPESKEYAQLRGECMAPEHTAILKDCTAAIALAKDWHQQEEQARLEKERIKRERQSWQDRGDDY